MSDMPKLTGDALMTVLRRVPFGNVVRARNLCLVVSAHGTALERQRHLIATALDEAEARGARAMRERAADRLHAIGVSRLAEAVRTMSLPGEGVDGG